MPDPTILTLSSIPPRFGALGPTLRSLLAQDLPAAEVRLYIPDRYRRFPDWDGTLPEVPDGVVIHRTEEDLGPATKVLPAARALRGQAVDILFCDDDRLYDRDWHRRLKVAREAHPEACICEQGETFPDIADEARLPDRLPRAHRLRKGWRYRLLRAATLFRVKPNQFLNDGYVDHFAGIDDAVFDIPGVLWTVDDPWLSGHLERRGIPIWLNRAPAAPVKRDSSGQDALHKLVEEGHGRVEADLAAIDHFRKVYGIWQPAGPLLHDHTRMTEPMRALLARAQRRQRGPSGPP